MTEEPIVRPARGANSPALGPLAVMASNRLDLERVQPALSPLDGDELRCRPLFNSQLYHPADGAGPCAVGPIVGAPYAVMVLETLAAWGVRRCLYLGWCGALVDALEIGDVLAPTEAVVDEGTSPAYGADTGTRVAPHGDLTQALDAAVVSAGLALHRRRVWTTDAVFRETPTRVAHFVETHQVCAVEMEVSALCAAARFLGLEMAAALVVSDSLAGGRWQPGFKAPRFIQTRQTLCEQIGALIQDPTWRDKGASAKESIR